jgi:hypothetical protein
MASKLYDKMDKKAKSTERAFKRGEDEDARDKQPEAKSDTKPVKEPHNEKGGVETKHEDGKEPIHERHHKEREHLHKRHEGERKDLHGNHREEHRQMHQRHEKDWKELDAKQDNELAGGVGGGMEAPAAAEPVGSPMAPGGA